MNKLHKPKTVIEYCYCKSCMQIVREALSNPTSPDLAEPTDANPTPLPIKPSLEDKPTISFDEKTFNQLLAEAEQRGYQKGREDALLMDAHQEAVDLAVREARRDELERIKVMFNLDWPTVKNQVIHRLAELSNKEVKDA